MMPHEGDSDEFPSLFQTLVLDASRGTGIDAIDTTGIDRPLMLRSSTEFRTYPHLDWNFFSVVLSIYLILNRPGRTRTCDPLLRRQMLYPPELRAQKVCPSVYLIYKVIGGGPLIA